MKRSFFTFIIIVLSSLFGCTDESQVYIEGRVIEAQSGNPISFARVELFNRGYLGGYYTGYSGSDLITSTNTDSLGNFTIKIEIEDCRGLAILAINDGFHQEADYNPKCTLGNRWQRFDIILDRDE